MKKLLVIAVCCMSAICHSQTVGIGTSSPNASAQLDISSTSRGLLPPRMSSSARDAIVAPVGGLMIWCNNCGISGEMQVFNGSTWTNMVGGSTSAPEVTIGTQRWMLKNLDISNYRNGDPIPKVTNNTEWASLTTGAYCYYNNDSATYASTYGKLYNWYAVNDPRGLAPAGWHVPANAEWETLSISLGGDAVAGGKMKETGTTYWQSPNTGATNSSGFTALPEQGRDFLGEFITIDNAGNWWSATEDATSFAWIRRILYNSGDLFTNAPRKGYGFAVRCVRD